MVVLTNRMIGLWKWGSTTRTTAAFSPASLESKGRLWSESFCNGPGSPKPLPCPCINCLAVRWKDCNPEGCRLLDASFLSLWVFLIWSAKLILHLQSSKRPVLVTMLSLHTACEESKTMFRVIGTNWFKPCFMELLEFEQNQPVARGGPRCLSVQVDQQGLDATLPLGRLTGGGRLRPR